MNDEPDANEEAKINVIADLAAKAPTNEVRDCIRVYDCKETIRNIEKKLRTISKPTLVDTLKYLKCPNMGIYIKERCIHELVCRIQNLLPDKCQLCTRTYEVKLDEKPVLSCVMCGQGCHNECILPLLALTGEEYNGMTNEDVEKLLNPLELPGFFYICPPCQIETVPSKETGLSKKAGKAGKPDKHVQFAQDERKLPEQKDAAENGNVSNTTDDENLSETEDKDSSETSQSEKDDSEPDEDEETTSNPDSDDEDDDDENARNRKKNKKKLLTKKQTKSKKSPKKNTETKTICRFYSRGNCRHGTSGHTNGECSYDHPKPCRKLLANGNRGPKGCQLGRECKFFHPRMCHDSLKHRMCLNSNCTYRHVSNTKRELPINPSSNGTSSIGYTGMQSGKFPSNHTQFQMISNANNIPLRSNNTPENFPFLGALEMLKKELVESMDRKIQSIIPQMRYQQEFPQLGTQTNHAPQIHPSLYQSRLVQQNQPMQSVTNQPLMTF